MRAITVEPALSGRGVIVRVPALAMADVDDLLRGRRLKKHNPLIRNDMEMIVADLAEGLRHPDFTLGVWQSQDRMVRAMGIIGFILRSLAADNGYIHLDYDWSEDQNAQETT